MSARTRGPKPTELRRSRGSRRPSAASTCTRELFDKKAAGIHPAPTGRLADALPEELRDRAERLLADLTKAGAAGGEDLCAELSRAKEWLDQQATTGRNRLEERWRALQQAVEGMRPAKDGL